MKLLKYRLPMFSFFSLVFFVPFVRVSVQVSISLLASILAFVRFPPNVRHCVSARLLLRLSCTLKSQPSFLLHRLGCYVLLFPPSLVGCIFLVRFMIILIILRCAVLNCFFMESVIAHVPAAYSIVGGAVVSNCLSLSAGRFAREFLSMVCEGLISCCSAACPGSWKLMICPSYFMLPSW